jgi:beta-galactosidase
LRGKTVWHVLSDGRITATVEATEKYPGTPVLPRFGIKMVLPKVQNTVHYVGRGPVENYVDMHYASYTAAFTSSVRDLHNDMVRPQENGSHGGCHSVTVTDGTHALLVEALNEPFSFNASHYTPEELDRRAHAYELRESDHTILHIDAHQCAVGGLYRKQTESAHVCGPYSLSFILTLS